MAAGRHGGYRDREIGYLKGGDYDRIKKGGQSRGRGSLEYRSRASQNDIKQSEVMNGGYRSTYSSSNSASKNVSKDKEGKKVLENGSRLSPVQNKKRKFSPIIWDRDDRVKNRNSVETTYPPPPPLLESLAPAGACEVYISESSPSKIDLLPDLSEFPAETSQEDALVNNQGTGEIDYDDDDYVPERTILSSRWANDADLPAGEDEISGTEEKQKLKRKTVSESAEVIGCSNSVSPRHSDTEPADDHVTSQWNVNMLQGCRSVYEFKQCGRIGEGTYGVVYMAKDNKTGETVALKKVKMGNNKDNEMDNEMKEFPLTALREINILISLHHPSIVDFKEVVVEGATDNVFDVYMVMEYMQHDLKGLMEKMVLPFTQSEVKCLMLQLLEGVKYLHDNWVLHRDLKTSNLLLNNRGELKICDFGLSRQYGSPLKPYTQPVVTLWYRSPELLLGAKEYSTAIDMWSVGCIMAELLTKKPLFNGTTELSQLNKIYEILGTPNETIWPGLSKLSSASVKFDKCYKYNELRKQFLAPVSNAGFDLLNKLLTYDPEKRITAEAALRHEWFHEVPLPKSKDFMPTFPDPNAQDRHLRRESESRDPLEEQRRKELQQRKLGTAGLFGY